MKSLSRFLGVFTMSRIHWLAIPAVLATLVLTVSPSSASAQDASATSAAASDVVVEVRGMQDEALKIRRDKAEILRLDRDVSSVILGDPGLVGVTVETPRRIVFVGAREGMTTLTVLDSNGDVITERALIVSSVSDNSNFVRVRRICANPGCEDEDVYYCEDNAACHTVLSEPVPVLKQKTAARVDTASDDMDDMTDDGDGDDGDDAGNTNDDNEDMDQEE